jgi:hypothetical protein
MKHLTYAAVGAAALTAALTPLALGASAAAPTVRFVTPRAGSTTGSTVVVRVALQHFTLDPKDVGKQPIPGKGHLHFQMDGGKYDFPRYSGANGQLAVKLGIAGTYSPSVTPTITYRHLPKGQHTLKVFLAENNHAPYTNPGATAVVHFKVA